MHGCQKQITAFMKKSNILNYPNYHVTSDGRVFNIKTGRCLKYGENNKGRLQVGLHRNGKVAKKLVHQLVASAYLPNPNNLPCVMHLDDNPLNNNVSNLQWGTQQENLADRDSKYRQAKGENNGRSKISDKQRIEIQAKYKTGKYTQREIGDYYGLHHSQISHIVNSFKQS